jgi:hypothetical protein
MKRLLAITGLAAMLLAACAAGPPAASARGTVTGTLMLEGGPLRRGGGQPGKRPIQGTVQFTADRHRPVKVRVGSSGTFSVRLSAGTYAVAGRSPRIMEIIGGTSRETSCSQPLSVTVAARHATRIAVTCIVP